MHFDLTKHNIGNTDRLIRAIAGAVLIVSTFLGSHWVGGLIGAVLLGTAYLRFCPAYALFDFSSNKEADPVAK
ncbi:YgaP family membrane protein [Thiorhodococcus minor]|uniref:DUF2892 domain-containing protein n=1 Tax=Thiorhodococcus minor TaxID=57489 RepID=A0A6M0K4R9_9GAMM|nr:DUF2892 domain-containing protein [Thiorhodococcus minor]NEV64419.1 DUF2892 domain-containing protein [Thiorhodococcus minor]